jgi:drug/metabolite transporter (DMT)-like permease
VSVVFPASGCEMIANVRRFSTSARRSMTVRRSTALRTSFAVLAVLSAAVFWGLNGIASKLLYRDAHFDALGLVAARGTWSFPIFVAMAYLGRPARMPDAGDLRRFAALGLCYGPIACGFLALGAQYTSGAHVSLLFSLAPPLTAVLGGLLLRERVDRLRVVALTIGLAGAILLASTRSATGSGLAGDLLLMVQITGIALSIVLTRSFGRRYNAFFLTGCYGAIGMAALAIAGFVGGGASTIVQTWRDPATAWWFFGEIVLGLSIYGQVAQSYALRALGAGTTAVLAAYGSLIVGLIGALTILHERIAPAGYVATALVAVSLGLALVPVRGAPDVLPQ